MPNPPLAGRPPFATDDDDSVFRNPVPAPRRFRQPERPDTGDSHRSSAYNTYDHYFDESGRDSATTMPAPHDDTTDGATSVGMGLLDGSLDDSDSDNESDNGRRPHKPAKPGKNQALFAAATRQTAMPQTPTTPLTPRRFDPHASPPQQHYQQQPPPQPLQPMRQNPYTNQNLNPPPSPNMMMQRPQQQGPVSVPQQVYSPMPTKLNAPLPLALQIPSPNPHYRTPPLSATNSQYPIPPMPGTPTSLTPHPLPPSTPIKAQFVSPPEPSAVKFSTESQMPIMRADTEDTLIPKPRPGAGNRADDNFWRRFSMVAHREADLPGEKTSLWLHKTQSGATRMSRWTWLLGIFILLCIAGGIGCAWYFTRNENSHQISVPVAIGGSASEMNISSSSSTSSSSTSTKKGASKTSAKQSSTPALAKRDAPPSATPISHSQRASHERRDQRARLFK